MIVLEEAAYINPQVFYEVVVPLMSVNNTALLAISTTLGSQNFYSKVMNIQDQYGRPLFNTISLELRCQRPECQNSPENCSHVWNRLPPWQSKESQAKTRAIMASESDLLQREILAMETDDCFYLFNQDHVDRLVDDNHVVHQNDLHHAENILVTIDTAAGGKASDFAIVSAVHMQNEQKDQYHMTIVGTEVFAAEDPLQVNRVIGDHLQALRGRFKMLPILVCPEQNMGCPAQFLDPIVKARGVSNVFMLNISELPSNWGVLTTDTSKQWQAWTTRRMLEQDEIHFMKDYVSTTLKRGPSGEDASKAKLAEQLKIFARIYRPPPNPFAGKGTTKYTGKHNNQKDDFAMALQINIYTRSLMWLKRERLHDSNILIRMSLDG